VSFKCLIRKKYFNSFNSNNPAADEWSCVLSVGVCCVSGVTVDTDENWCSQINRLQQLIDKLECQVN